MRYRVDPSSDVPPSRQLQEQLLDAIARGELAPGDQLPSVRALAAEALVNPNTVAKAIRDLEIAGVLVGRNGLGVFVSDAAPRVAVARRRSSTLASFETALHEALRAGHSPQELLELVDRAASVAPGEAR
jgi:GntR family transcriptional regulator